jgi:hypothetical protein
MNTAIAADEEERHAVDRPDEHLAAQGHGRYRREAVRTARDVGHVVHQLVRHHLKGQGEQDEILTRDASGGRDGDHEREHHGSHDGHEERRKPRPSGAGRHATSRDAEVRSPDQDWKGEEAGCVAPYAVEHRMSHRYLARIAEHQIEGDAQNQVKMWMRHR